MADLRVTTIQGTDTVLTDTAIASFRTSVRGELVCATDAGYETARKVWNGMIDRRPALIVRCTGVADVITAVQFARTHTIGNPTSSKSSVMRPSTSWSPTARPGRRRSAAWLWANWGAR